MERKIIIAVALLASVLIGLVGLVAYYQPLRPYTALSVSSISIDPQGSEDPTTKEWTGSFWTIAMLTDCNDQVAAYTFDKSQSEKGTNTIGDKKLVPQSTITIRIDPQQPYWERPIEIKSVSVVPKTFGLGKNKIIQNQWKWTDVTAGVVNSGHYEWGTGYWTAHTPFLVTVLKNNVQIGQKTIDTVGVTATIRIPDSGAEYITVTDLGKLGTGYGEPQLGDIMFFSLDEIFKLDSHALNLVKYDADADSYSNYWYDSARWNDDKTPMGWIGAAGGVGAESHAGWVRDDSTLDWRNKPIAPVVLPGDKASLPARQQGFYSLTEYLGYKGIQKIDPWVWKDSEKPEIVTDSSTGSQKLRIYMPFSSMNSLITLKISTELADTIVWQPQVANIKITSMSNLGDIGDRKLGTLTVTQESTVASSGTISLTVDPTSAPLSINPESFGTGTMNPGDTKTFTYEILNLGTTKDVSFSIKAVATNSLGNTTDSKTVTGTLKPKGAGETVLTVWTMDDATKNAVSGIQVTVGFDSQSKSGITSDGSVSWNLGSAQPSVTVTSAETLTYQSKTVSKQLASGPNDVYLWLVRQGVVEIPWWIQYWWVFVVIGVITVTIVTVVYTKRRG